MLRMMNSDGVTDRSLGSTQPVQATNCDRKTLDEAVAAATTRTLTPVGSGSVSPNVFTKMVFSSRITSRMRVGSYISETRRVSNTPLTGNRTTNDRKAIRRTVLRRPDLHTQSSFQLPRAVIPNDGRFGTH